MGGITLGIGKHHCAEVNFTCKVSARVEMKSDAAYLITQLKVRFYFPTGCRCGIHSCSNFGQDRYHTMLIQ